MERHIHSIIGPLADTFSRDSGPVDKSPNSCTTLIEHGVEDRLLRNPGWPAGRPNRFNSSGPVGTQSTVVGVPSSRTPTRLSRRSAITAQPAAQPSAGLPSRRGLRGRLVGSSTFASSRTPVLGSSSAAESASSTTASASSAAFSSERSASASLYRGSPAASVSGSSGSESLRLGSGFRRARLPHPPRRTPRPPRCPPKAPRLHPSTSASASAAASEATGSSSSAATSSATASASSVASTAAS